MTNVTFPYEDWNDQKDVRMFRASKPRAFNTVDSALDIGDVPVGTHPKRDINVGPAIDEITALLTECVEWLRHRGVSATKVQAAFNNVKGVQRASQDHQKLLDSWEEINLPADPQGWTPRIEKQGLTVKNF